MFFLLYKFLLNANVPSNLAFKAALVAGVLWEVSKGLFANLIEASAAQRGLIYGSLTGVIVLMFWIFVTGIILLLGAELAAAYHFAEEEERCATDQTIGMPLVPNVRALVVVLKVPLFVPFQLLTVGAVLSVRYRAIM